MAAIRHLRLFFLPKNPKWGLFGDYCVFQSDNKKTTDTSLAMASKNSQRSEDISVAKNNISHSADIVKLKHSI